MQQQTIYRHRSYSCRRRTNGSARLEKITAEDSEVDVTAAADTTVCAYNSVTAAV